MFHVKHFLAVYRVTMLAFGYSRPSGWFSLHIGIKALINVSRETFCDFPPHHLTMRHKSIICAMFAPHLIARGETMALN